MDEGFTNLPSSHMVGSVPAVIADDRRSAATVTATAEAPHANLQIFPPTSGGGYQAPGTPYGVDDQTQTTWKGYFNISSYSPYFNVDTDVVADRVISSVYPMNDFFRKIDANPDLYGPVWIATTLVFMLSAFGNCATYLMNKRNNPDMPWNFDVNYVNWAACVIYGYALALPAGFYFLLRYFGSNTSLVRLWCLWGYSLSIFMPISFLLIIPLEFLRWIIIILAGSASSWFIMVNLKELAQGNDLMMLVVSASVLQFTLSVFIKVSFFP